MHRVLKIGWVIVIVSSLWTSAGAAKPAHAEVVLATATHTPLVYAPAISVLPGPQAGGTLLGAVLFSSFGSTSTTSADLYLGVVPSNTTPSKNRVNFYHDTSTPSSGVKSGDCSGNWNVASPNRFDLEYQPATSDRLTITLSNTSVISDLNCSLVFSNFTRLVSNTHGITTSLLVPLMNYLEVSIKRNSTSYTSTLTNLELNDVLLPGAFNPVTTTTATSHIASAHLGNGFKLAGELNLTGAPGNCATTCEIEIRFGTAPAQITVQKHVSGHTPATDWQYNGPNGAFTLPAVGGSTVITPLGSNTYVMSETAKTGFTSSAACSNGAAGSDGVSVTPNAGEVITCTFSSEALPSDLAISKHTISDSVQAGSTITYALVVSNVGAGPAYNAIITDSVPPSLTLIGAQSDAGECAINNNDIICNAGFINTSPFSSPVTIIVTTTAPADDGAIGTVLTNTAGVTDALDTMTLTNNFAASAITLRAIEQGDIVVSKRVNGLAPASGAFSYTLQGPNATNTFALQAGGTAAFTRLAAGMYVLRETSTLGYKTNITCEGESMLLDEHAIQFALTAGGIVTCTFTNSGENAITGTLWHDQNENQSIDGTELLLSNVTVALSGALAGGSILSSTTTNAAGEYAFAGLPDGEYTLTLMSNTLTAGLTTPTYDRDGIDTPHVARLVACCSERQAVNFGYRGEGRIGDSVFYDVNNNGVQDAGDLPLAQIKLNLMGDLNNDGVVDVLTATTNSAGIYFFSSMLPGAYTITVDPATLPAGLSPTVDAAGIDTPNTASIQLGEAPNFNIDFGYRGDSSINGFVWEDTNGNGGIDAGEPAQNAALMLQGDLNGDGVIDTLHATPNAGAYTFANLVPGTYTITVDAVSLPAGMQPVDGQFSRRITVSGMHENIAGVDFGFVRPASIQGRVWLDANRNGAQDAGERGMGGIVITLFKAANAQDAFTAKSIGANYTAITTSNAGGEYRFDGIMPGQPYTLHFALPAGFAWTLAGIDSVVDENGDTSIIRLTSGENVIFKANAGATKPTQMTINKVAQPPTIQLGDRITYTIMIRNTGDTMAHNVVISDSLPAELRYISAIPWPSLPAVEEGKLVWAVGDLDPGQAFTVTLMTQLKPDATPGSYISNTAFLLADMQTVVASNDMQSSATALLQPTAITLASFDAVMDGAGVRLSWRTLLEQNTFGFNVLRSATGNRADAIRVNTELIPAGSAGSYALLDAGGNVNDAYWLQEMELNGATSEHGPFSVRAPAMAAMPALTDGPASPVNAPPGGVPIVQSQPALAQIQPPANTPSEQTAPVALMQSIDTEPATMDKQNVEPLATTSAGKAASAQQPVATQATPTHAEPTTALPPETKQITITDTSDASSSANAVNVLRGNASPTSIAMDDSPQGNESSLPVAVLPAGLAMGCVLMVLAGVIRRKRHSK